MWCHPPKPMLSNTQRATPSVALCVLLPQIENSCLIDYFKVGDLGVPYVLKGITRGLTPLGHPFIVELITR